MQRSAAFLGSALLILSACAGTGSEKAREPSADAPVLHGSGAVIQSPDHGPMIAWSFLFSYPPQGGVLALSNWDWNQVDGEESGAGTTWGGPYDFVGVWDGSEFTLTEPAVSVRAGADRFQPGGTDCTDPALSDTVEFLRALDRNALGLGSRGSRTIDGECVAFVEAYFDTPELRAALAPIAADVQVDLYFRPDDG